MKHPEFRETPQNTLKTPFLAPLTPQTVLKHVNPTGKTPSEPKNTTFSQPDQQRDQKRNRKGNSIFLPLQACEPLGLQDLMPSALRAGKQRQKTPTLETACYETRFSKTIKTPGPSSHPENQQRKTFRTFRPHVLNFFRPILSSLQNHPPEYPHKTGNPV